MKRATIVLAGVLVLAMATAMPATAEAVITDTEPNPPCVDIQTNPVGVTIDPACVIDLLPRSPSDEVPI